MPLPKHSYRVTWFMEEPSCRLWQRRYFTDRELAEAFAEGLRREPANISIRIEVLP